MTLQIVKYTIHHFINRILYLINFAIFLIFIYLGYLGYTNFTFSNSKYLIICISTIVFAWVIHSLFFIRHAVIGICILDHHSICFKYNDGMIERIEFTELLFIDGGYKGKDNGFNKLLTAHNTKEGANNYLVMNNDHSNKVQILLTSRQEYIKLKDYLASMQEYGVNAQKVHYMTFWMRNLTNFFRCKS